MNIDRKVLVFVLFFVIMFGGCNFNEDFCIWEGEFVVWCDFSGIKEKLFVFQERYVIFFGMDVLYFEGIMFIQDIFCWSLFQGVYRFLFYMGNYELLDRNDYYEMCLFVWIDIIDGEVYILEVQKFCCFLVFSERFEYWNFKWVRIQFVVFVQKLNIKINVFGNIVLLFGLNCIFLGIFMVRYLVFCERIGIVSVIVFFVKKVDNVWMVGFYVFGFSLVVENIFVVEVLMKEEDFVFNEWQLVDLILYLWGFDGDEILLELDLYIGRELEIGGLVIILDWEDIFEMEFL